MSAERLLEAAALMRSRAEAAITSLSDNTSEWYSAKLLRTRVASDADAEHIASWPPVVALAVARWLDDESYAPETDHGDGITTGGPRMEALAVANAYLGTPDP